MYISSSIGALSLGNLSLCQARRGNNCFGFVYQKGCRKVTIAERLERLGHSFITYFIAFVLYRILFAYFFKVAYTFYHDILWALHLLPFPASSTPNFLENFLEIEILLMSMICKRIIKYSHFHFQATPAGSQPLQCGVWACMFLHKSSNPPFSFLLQLLMHSYWVECA